MVNIAGKPRRTLPTFVNFSKSYAFCGDGPGTILDTSGVEYVTEEPNADERERAMGFLTGTTHLSDNSISEYQRRMLLGQAMDLNCLTWILAIVVTDQHRLHAMVSSVPLFSDLRAALQSLPHPGTDFEVAGGESQQPLHPWRGWSSENSCEGHLGESCKTLEEHMDNLFFSREDTTMDKTSIVLGMTGTENDDSVSTGVA